jgi:quercetin dioxygenase-like cupin family protein
MQIRRLDDARPFEAPKHFDMRALRMQGAEASDADFAWVALSHFLPGGGADKDSSPFGKIYVMLEGELVIELADGTRETLTPMDSCYLPAGTTRSIANRSNRLASMLVITPNLTPAR